MDGVLRYDGLKLDPLEVTRVIALAADGRVTGKSAGTTPPVDWIIGLLDVARGHPREPDLYACLDIALRSGSTAQVAVAAEVDRRRPYSHADALFAAATARHVHTSRDAMRALSLALRDGVRSGRDPYHPRLRELISMPRMREALAPVWAEHDLAWTIEQLRTVLGDDAPHTVARLTDCLHTLTDDARATLLSAVEEQLDVFSPSTAAALRPLLRAHGLTPPEPAAPTPEPPAPRQPAQPPPRPTPALAPPPAPAAAAAPAIPRPVPISPLVPVFERPERGSRPRRIVGLVPLGVVPPSALLDAELLPAAKPEPPPSAPPAPAVPTASKFRSKRDIGGKYAGRREPPE